MPPFLRSFGVAALIGAALPILAQQPGVLIDTTKRAPPPEAPSAVTPPADQGRGVDAEIRAALFDLVADRPITALSRLEFLSASGKAMMTQPAAGQRTREDLLFLLAESYYRLGLSLNFRATTQQLLTLAPQGRYVPLIQMQLMLDAYRRGDFAGARAIAAKTPALPDATLADFVTGLASYQLGDYAAAHASFAKVTAGAYAPYARYMDGLAAMQGDTTKAPAALATIAPLAQSAHGPFADQARLTASHLAFQTGRFDDATHYAAQISDSGGLAPEAQLARAWSYYRAGRYDSAAALFGDFADRYPQLPGRDEARLMHGQILLEQHQPAAAEAYFSAIGDSLGGEVANMQARMNAAMAQAARALVAARAAGALYVREAESGKSLALAPNAGAEGTTLVAAFGGQAAAPAADSAPPAPITVAELGRRFDAIQPALPADIPRRPFYAPVSSPKAYATFADRDQTLLTADLVDAVVKYRLQNATADHLMRIAALRNLQVLIAEGDANLVEMNKQIAFTQDSVAKMTAVLSSARVTVRDALVKQGRATANASETNVRKLDSLKAALGTAASPVDLDIIDIERSTAQVYGNLAQWVVSHADSAISRHPAYALRDSLTTRLARAKSLSVEGQQLLVTNKALVTAELAAVEANESDRMKNGRRGLAAADQMRENAESQMVQAVNAELLARASSMVDALKKSREAADYGSASAAFFTVLEGKTNNASSAPTAAPPAPEHR